MTRELARFIVGRPFGFVTEAEMPAIVEQDRLIPLLVRCGGTRFMAGAQYISGLLKMVEAAGDYVRDVSFPAGVINEARQVEASGKATMTEEERLMGAPGLHVFAGEPAPVFRTAAPRRRAVAGKADKPTGEVTREGQTIWYHYQDAEGNDYESQQPPGGWRRQVLSEGVIFNEGDCGGAFDGFQVTSDADPGL